MTKNRIIGILAILIVYFGLILMTAMFAAIGLVEEIPVWSLPLFAIVSIGMAMFVGDIRWLDVVLVFLVCILLFPIGPLLLIDTAGKLDVSQTLSIIFSEMSVSKWLMTASPLLAAALAHFGFGYIRRRS